MIPILLFQITWNIKKTSTVQMLDLKDQLPSPSQGDACVHACTHVCVHIYMWYVCVREREILKMFGFPANQFIYINSCLFILDKLEYIEYLIKV